MMKNDNVRIHNSRPDPRRETGKAGEAYAVEFLQRNGYEILHVNARLGRMGEIDIVARDRDALVFVEVKTRHSNLFGEPQESVNFRKQKKCCQCALLYLKKRNMNNKNFRFDVAAVMLNRDNTLKNIEVIKNAF